MAAGVLMNNSPTPHRSRNISQATPNTGASTTGVQPNKPTPDDVVDRLLERAKSPMGEAEVWKVVETLEKMLQPQFQLTLRTKRRCFRGLVKLCGEYGFLPSSYIIPESKIKKLDDSHIASGGFSEVSKGVYEGNKSVAIKVIRLFDVYSLNPQGAKGIKEVKKNFCREVITWKRLSHPNILELLGVMMDDKEYTMVTPLMKNGTIVDFLRDNLQVNPLKLLGDAVRGLQYLHSIELAHGDLKGANILISDDGRACLADVGLTRVAGDLGSAATSQTSTSSGASTRRWCPPELLDPERFESKRGGPTKKADMYSMGMTIYEVLTDRIPFYEYNDCVTILCVLEGVRPNPPIFATTRGYTKELWEMTTYCWKEDPSDRPTVDYLLVALKSAAEQWKPKHGALAALSPGDDWSPSLAEESDSSTASEHENEPTTSAAAAASTGPFQPLVTKPRVPTTPYHESPTTATGVLMGDSHTPHPSTDTRKANPTTASVRPRRTSGTGRTHDEMLDRLLVMAKSPLGEGDFRKVVDGLEKMLRPKFQMSLPTRKRCLRGLVKICGERGILPSSCAIPQSEVQKLGDEPISSSELFETWPGMYGEDRFVSIKIIRHRDSDDIREIQKNFCREVITWKQLSHPNILELVGATMDDREYSMVSPWMENGSVITFLGENPEANPLKLLEDAACGLQYLHSMDIAHGNLRGENVLISDDCRACLADAVSQTPTTIGGNTVRWFSPELLGSGRGGPTKMSDVYSMSMTVYEVLTDGPPFHEHGDTVAMISILKGGRPEKPDFDATRGYTKELWKMSKSCWKEDPNDRPTVDYVLGVLRNAAERWGSEHGEVDTESPGNNRSSTPLTERQNSPTVLEHENEPATTIPASPRYPRSPVIETRVPHLVPTPSLPSPLATKNGTLPISIPPTSPKKIEPMPYSPLREKGPKPIPTISTGETKSVSDNSSRGEDGPKPIPSTLEMKPVSASLLKREKDLKPTPATPKETRPAPANPSREELESTKHVSVNRSKDTGPALADRERKEPELECAASKDEGKPAPVSPSRERGPEHTTAASKEKTKPSPANPPKEEELESTPATWEKRSAPVNGPPKGKEPKPSLAIPKVEITPTLSSPSRGGEGPRQTPPT